MASQAQAISSIEEIAPLSHWRCEETSGIRYDSTATGNDLTDNNTVTQTTGKQGNACQFTSANSEYLSITDASATNLDPTGDFTWNYWIYYNSDTNAVAHAKYSTGQQGYWFQENGANSNFTDSSETGHYFSDTPSMSTWYMYTIVKHGNNAVCVFRDGSLVSCVSSGTVNNVTAPFEIGRLNRYNSNYLNGYIDEFTVDNTVWATTTITDVYNSGNGVPYYTPSSTPPTSTTSSSTVAMDDTNFLLGVIIFFLTFLLLANVFSIGRK